MALYDPNEFPETVETTKDFTLADVLAWARTKHADEPYDYDDPGRCALCQFLGNTGRAKAPRVVPSDWRDGIYSGDRHPLDAGLDRLARNDFDRDGWTFGAFADRLEKALGR